MKRIKRMKWIKLKMWDELNFREQVRASIVTSVIGVALAVFSTTREFVHSVVSANIALAFDIMHSILLFATMYQLLYLGHGFWMKRCNVRNQWGDLPEEKRSRKITINSIVAVLMGCPALIVVVICQWISHEPCLRLVIPISLGIIAYGIISWIYNRSYKSRNVVEYIRRKRIIMRCVKIFLLSVVADTVAYAMVIFLVVAFKDGSFSISGITLEELAQQSITSIHIMIAMILATSIVAVREATRLL